MPGILALDPSSTATGWAHAEPGESPTWGHQRLGNTKTQDDTDPISEALEIFLNARIATFKPQAIVRESTFDGPNPNTNRILHGIAWQIDMQARQHKIPCYKIGSSQCIKWFTGQGKFLGKTYEQRRAAKKRATIQTAQAYGWQCTEDEADALALLCFAEAKLFIAMRTGMRRPAGPLFCGGRPTHAGGTTAPGEG